MSAPNQTANKAAEEGGLLALKRYDINSKGLPFEDPDGVWVAYEDVAADSASRQVANKAEVDLSDDRIYDFWLYRDCMPAIQAGDMKAQFVSAVRALLATSPATPPATTGANTAPDRHPWFCAHCQTGVPSNHVTYEERHDPNAGGCGYRVGDWPERASTVLTDERKLRDFIVQWSAALYPNPDELMTAIKANIGLSVAAQAGQVAPAQPLAMVSPSELRDIQAGRGGVPVRGNQWRADQTVPIYAAPVAGQVAVPEAVRVLREAIEKQLAPEWNCNSDHPALAAALKATEHLALPAKESK